MLRRYLLTNGGMTGRIDDSEIALLTKANSKGERWMTLKDGTGFFVQDLALPPSIMKRQTEGKQWQY